MGVVFQTCPMERAGELREFFAQRYSPNYVLAKNEDFFMWQFGASPNPERTGLDVKLALVDGAIAGCVGYVPAEIQVGGRTVRGAWACNWMVDDQYRKFGLGPLLIRELRKDFDVMLALGGNRDAHALLPRMGWTDFGDLPRHVAILDVDEAARLTESGSIEGARTVRTGDAAGTARVESFDQDVSAVWDRCCGHLAGTRRTADFLNWRYTQHPVFDYRLFRSGTGAEDGGFAVYRVEPVQDLGRVGRIVEIVGDGNHASALVDAIVNDARSQGVSMLDFFGADDKLAGVLEQAGFAPGNDAPASQMPMLFQPIDRSRTGVLFMAHVGPNAPANWYVTTADGDQDRPN